MEIISDVAQLRIDKYLTRQLDDYTRSYIQKLLKDGHIHVNGKPVKANYQLSLDDQITINFPPNTELEILPSNIPLDILYEDSQILVVNKPKGMVVHPAAGHFHDTLVNALLYHCKDELSGINGVMRPGIVHRIDKDTTGSLVVCKTDRAHQCLALQLKEHSIIRIYHGIVDGVIKEASGTIEMPIGRDSKDRKKMSVKSKYGKEAYTHYQVIQRFKHHTYCQFQLETGRTHQIRVHMASIHHPLTGDTVYGPAKQPFSLTGQTLHAKILGFYHPTSHEYMEFDAPLPDYFLNLLKKLEKI